MLTAQHPQGPQGNPARATLEFVSTTVPAAPAPKGGPVILIPQQRPMPNQAPQLPSPKPPPPTKPVLPDQHSIINAAG